MSEAEVVRPLFEIGRDLLTERAADAFPYVEEGIPEVIRAPMDLDVGHLPQYG